MRQLTTKGQCFKTSDAMVKTCQSWIPPSPNLDKLKAVTSWIILIYFLQYTGFIYDVLTGGLATLLEGAGLFFDNKVNLKSILFNFSKLTVTLSNYFYLRRHKNIPSKVGRRWNSELTSLYYNVVNWLYSRLHLLFRIIEINKKINFKVFSRFLICRNCLSLIDSRLLSQSILLISSFWSTTQSII